MPALSLCPGNVSPSLQLRPDNEYPLPRAGGCSAAPQEPSGPTMTASTLMRCVASPRLSLAFPLAAVPGLPPSPLARKVSARRVRYLGACANVFQ